CRDTPATRATRRASRAATATVMRLNQGFMQGNLTARPEQRGRARQEGGRGPPDTPREHGESPPSGPAAGGFSASHTAPHTALSAASPPGATQKKTDIFFRNLVPAYPLAP